MSIHTTETLIIYCVWDHVLEWATATPLLCCDGLKALGIELPNRDIPFVFIVSDKPIPGGTLVNTDGYHWCKEGINPEVIGDTGRLMGLASYRIKQMFPELGDGSGVYKAIWLKVKLESEDK